MQNLVIRKGFLPITLDLSYKMDLEFCGCFGGGNFHLIMEEIRQYASVVNSEGSF